MDPTTTDEDWRTFTDPHGYFHIELPASWRVEQSDGPFFHGHHAAHRFLTTLEPAANDNSSRRTWMTIRIEQYAETPPPMKGSQEPTDLQYLRTYRIIHGSDWLTCVVGHLRIHIEYQIQGISHPHAYRPMGWEPPAPLSQDEQRRRLAIVQRIIASFALLPSG